MTVPLAHYEPPSRNNWQGRQDSLSSERFFQQVDICDLRHQVLPSASPIAHITILGLCSDTGIQRNLGQLGAQEGPDALRQQLAKLASHRPERYIDIGNIRCTNNDLESAQLEFAQLVVHCQKYQHRTLAFGGGHEIAWAHFLGLNKHHPDLAIINFDAHFDLRPLKNGQGTSGTPFRQIQTFCNQQQLDFHYCCLGIQPAGNTSSLFAHAAQSNIAFLTAERMFQEPLSFQIDFLEQFMRPHSAIYLSFCMDVLAEAFAPGVSAPQALGLFPSQVIPLLKYILQSGKVVGLDIAELSPVLDSNHQTARLAGMITAALLEYY